MSTRFPHRLLEDPEELARFEGWSEEVYADFLALQHNTMSRAAFRGKYGRRRAILDLDLTGFTRAAMHQGQISSLLRVFDSQKICIPVLHDKGADLIRAFADDLIGLFEQPDAALDAALEIHRRVALYNQTLSADVERAECCIGIGYGDVYAIGPNLAQGDEMNRTAKLGEDTARGGETLLTEGAYTALAHRTDVSFRPVTKDDLPFTYYRVDTR